MGFAALLIAAIAPGTSVAQSSDLAVAHSLDAPSVVPIPAPMLAQDEATSDQAAIEAAALPPTIHVVSPIGGDRFYVGRIMDVRWTTTSAPSGRIDLAYSRSGLNGTYTPIAIDLPDTGHFVWRVPPPATENGFVRVTVHAAGDSASDTNDAAFAVTPFKIDLTAPNGFETLVEGQGARVVWSSEGIDGGLVDLYISRSGRGGPFTRVATGVPDTGSFTWVVTGPGPGSAFAVVEVYDDAGNRASDISDEAFDIIDRAEAPEVHYVSPAPPDTFTVGDLVEIRWTATDTRGIESIDLTVAYEDSFGFVNSIARKLENDGAHVWRIARASPRAFIGVTARNVNGVEVTDWSDGPFVILPPAVAAVTRFEVHPSVGGAEVAWQIDQPSLATGVRIDRRSLPDTTWRRVNLPISPHDDFSVLVDTTVVIGSSYSYRLAFTSSGQEIRSNVVTVTIPSPPALEFAATASPNPSRSLPRVEYALTQAAHVRVTLLDLFGRRVATLADFDAGAGRYLAVWPAEANDARPGIYLLRFEAGSQVLTKRFALLGH